MGLSLWYYIAAIAIFAFIQWKRKKLSISILVSYIFLVLSTTVFSRQSRETVAYNSIPLKFLLAEDEWTRQDYLRQMWANAVMFIPFGFLMPHVFKHKKGDKVLFKILGILLTIITSLFISAGIEYLQLSLKRGYSEIDDVIGNMFGTVIGIIIYVMYPIWTRQHKVHMNRNC